MDSLDLKSMKVLLSLYTTKNTYHTAELLDLSQSSVARTLAKSRRAFNDPLFIRSGNQLCPTAFTEALSAKLPSLICDFESIVSRHIEFEPAKLTGSYQISLNRTAQLLHGAKLFKILSQSAPNATWYLKGWESNVAEQLLDDRSVIGVNYYSPDFPNSIIQQPLFDDEFSILASETHPLHEKEHITWQEIIRFPFVSLSIPSWDERNRYLNDVFKQAKGEPQVQLQTDSIELALQVAESSTMLLAASREMTKGGLTSLIPLNLRIADDMLLPSAQVVCSYARKNIDKPLVKWVISLLIQVASTLKND